MKVSYRVALVAVLVVLAVLYLTPTLVQPLPPGWPSFFPREPIRLGLDLQGGIHLILQVEVDKAVENSVDRIGEDLKRELATAQILTGKLERAGQTLRVRLASAEQSAAFSDLIRDKFPTLVFGSEPAGEGEVVLGLEARELKRIREFAIDQSLETIRNRIDQFGVREPLIQRSGSDGILVQLPGIQDPQRAKDLIGKTAVLEFKLVTAGAADPAKPMPGTEVLYGQERDPVTGTMRTKVPYTVERKTLMTGEVIANANVRPSTQLEGPYVEVELNGRGAKLFEEITAANVGRQLAIILDRTVYSAPVIKERIGGGRASITGNFDLHEARDLAIVLRAGALPAPVTLAEERSVGPTLGRDSIRQGVVSFAIGGALIVLFMIVYYRGAGFLADLALILNVLLIMGALAAFEATLTLPGIAGLVLTLGMAVDANVLINERIREELRLGKTVRAAVEGGYERALPSILDSNITTLLSGAILFQFGSGPVKGFAVTLCIGLITSVFTAVVCTRIVYDWLLSSRRLRSISI